MALSAKQFTLDGARSLKVKVGTDRDEDVARVCSIRAAAGKGVQIRLDANQAWDEKTALSVLETMAEYDVQVCEQPLPYWNIEGFKAAATAQPNCNHG